MLVDTDHCTQRGSEDPRASGVESHDLIFTRLSMNAVDASFGLGVI